MDGWSGVIHSSSVDFPVGRMLMDGHCEGWDQSPVYNSNYSELPLVLPVGSDAGFVKATCCSDCNVWASAACLWVVLAQKFVSRVPPRFAVLTYSSSQISSRVGSRSASPRAVNQARWSRFLMNQRQETSSLPADGEGPSLWSRFLTFQDVFPLLLFFLSGSVY